MTNVNRSSKELYHTFSLSPDCSDDELRQAYRRLLFINHPDLNPSNIEEATRRTQEINEAYTTLKDYRENPGTFSVDSPNGISVRVDFSFNLGLQIDLKDIARRKDDFHKAFDNFQNHPTDTLAALRLIHASFEAERYKELRELLKHPVLIDASVILIKLFGNKKAANTLIRWADQLRQMNLIEQGLQILEDSYSAGMTEEPILDELRSFHYSIAQGYQTEDKKKPEPSIRIKHLSRILDLGFQLDYIYKLLAEAYFETGDTINALSKLKRAYEINPELTGAVKISRALGILPQQEQQSRSKSVKVNYVFNLPEQIPHPSQIRIWASEGSWDKIIAFADLNLYSPRIIPSARSTIRQIAASLGDCPDTKAKDLLCALQDSVYWDVRDACKASLDRWGKGIKPQLVSEPFTDQQKDIEEILWNMLVFEAYHPASDDKYESVITYLANRTLTSNTPAEVLGSLRKLTRWLEMLGLGEMAQWIRDLIRHEAPGTYYVDSHDRENYVQKVQISDNLQAKINPILENVKIYASGKLAQVLASQMHIKKSNIPSGNKKLPKQKLNK
jgi:tetratricopeptide (TPR) repeat protein